jgi:hypothetical protein
MNFYEIIKKKIKTFFGLDKITEKVNSLKILNGKLLALKHINQNFSNINDYEFKVFSQFGEDGIIQFLINNIKISKKKFVEFGVENYEEANTRFLLENNCWSGLIIESSKKHSNYIKKQNYYWKYDLKVLNKFVSKENINSLLKENNFVGDIGILSIDIDGNDYWIWDSIDIVKPDIVIIEYNARLGCELSLTIPYESNFVRKNKNYGASLPALNKLAEKKNYKLVGTNLNGNNAFFVRDEKLKDTKIKHQELKESFHTNSFSESRNRSGQIIKETNDINISDFIKV